VRAWESREVEARSGHDKGKYNFKSITADETEFLFLMLCPCLDGLVDSAVHGLNTARKQVSPLPEPVKDPMPACLLACGRLLTWYSNSMTPNMTRKQIMECKEEGAQAMLLLQETFPCRNMSVGKGVSNIMNPPIPKAARVAQEKCKSKWGMPKGHAVIQHVNESTFVVGNLMNCSAQVIEMKHLSIKKDAARTNNKKNWELQVLIKQQVRDNASEQMWKQTEDDEEENMEELWVAKCKPRARASFGHSMYSTALRYPVFTVVSEHTACSRRLSVRAMQPTTRSQLNIKLNTLTGTDSGLVHDCADLKHLPEAMARFLCDKYRPVDPQRFPDRHVQLDHTQIHDLMNLTGRTANRPPNVLAGEGALGGSRKRACVSTFVRGELASYHSVVIEHPQFEGEVIFDRYILKLSYLFVHTCIEAGPTCI